jgi:hypothetical protein
MTEFKFVGVTGGSLLDVLLVDSELGCVPDGVGCVIAGGCCEAVVVGVVSVLCEPGTASDERSGVDVCVLCEPGTASDER